jgi:GTP cyclohydrolase I/GTP cyclohydrolase-4
VEDCVREAIRMAVDEYRDLLGEKAFVMSRQENLETIHQHNVVAERYGLLGELAEELTSDHHALRHVTMREWLEGH